MILIAFRSRVGVCRHLPSWVGALLWAGGILLASQLRAQPAEVPAANSKVITNAQNFWDLSTEEKQKPHRIRFEILVYYYDPYWQLLWGECEGASTFLPVRGEPLPIKPGQRVRLEGIIMPARGILRNEITITVLDENAMPEPLSAHGRVNASHELDAKWVNFEGYVCEQRQTDPYHVEYQVLSEGWLATVRLLVKDAVPVPQLVDAKVRFVGVYVGDHDANQKLQHIDFWVPRMTDVTFLSDVADDPRFRLPRTRLEALPSANPEEWVRVEGTVKEFKSGRNLTLRDDTGQISIATPQPGTLKAGDRIEVIGLPSGTGIELTLSEAHFRAIVSDQAKVTKGSTAPRIHLRVVEQIMELPANEVAKGYHVTLKGVVTWADPRVNFFYVQDATGGICIRREENVTPPLIGDSVEVEGLTQLGRYAPEVQLERMASQGPMAKPTAPLITMEHALTGAEEARRVELRGYVRQVAEEALWSRLDLTTSSGEFSAYLPPDKTLSELNGAVVRVAGVCTAETNSLRQLTGIRVWVSGKDAVEMDEPAPADPFAVAHYSIAGLNQFTAGGPFSRRVAVKGHALLLRPGHYLLMQDGESGLMVFSREIKQLAPESMVEISGFPGREGSRLVLREAISRAATGGGNLQPVACEHLAETRPELDIRLVQVEGVLNGAVVQGERMRLTLQADGVLFDAILEPVGKWRAPALGSRLQLTGVYLLEFDEYHRPRGFRLELRTPGDVRVVATPAWWTVGRAFAMAGGFAVFILLGIGWVTVLRRRVKEQTALIRQQMDKEVSMQAELERATRLDSLGVLAGGIAHDFNNLLTAIRGNLGLIQLEPEVMKLVGEQVNGADRAAKRATDVTQQLLTFAKGGDPVRLVVELAEVVKEAAGFARHGSNVRVEFEMGEGLPPAEVDASQISRVVHNLVLNAVQSLSGGGGVVRLVLTARDVLAGDVPSLPAGRYLQLSVIDNGPGIPADRLPRIFDPYFTTKVRGSGLGLATCHSIVKKHLGHIEVKSSPTEGTTFRIWLPAATRSAASEKSSSTFPALVASARVLFMDDDDVVRNLARTFLARAGHDGTLVSDGAEAVTAYRQAKAAGNDYDVVILDLTVPGGMGGKDALAELRKIDPSVRVIASSGYSNDPVMANHQAFGFAAVLPKPYDLEALTRAITRVRRLPG